MKLYTRMPERLKYYYKAEMQSYRLHWREKNPALAWKHLERMHVLGQAYPPEHSYAHLLMLRFAWKVKDLRELLGQLPRLLVGGIKSFVGKVPAGNTGGAKVPPLKRMEIPGDLKQMLSQK